MTMLVQQSVLITDPENLDASVDEVFRLMLGVNCERGEKASEQEGSEQESLTAVVGFGGVLSGACVFRCSAQSAIAIAAQMTGMEIKRIDDTVKDGMGELCNMLAGTWKGKLPGVAASCGLSVPAVISGQDYRVHVQRPEFQLQRAYRFGEAHFTLTIHCDGLRQG
jgi:chemotaxis protein CheX